MQEFSNYKVIEHFDLAELQNMVNLHLQKGWELCGGIAMVIPDRDRQDLHFAQAIVFRSKNSLKL
jgi:hypothetical protein